VHPLRISTFRADLDFFRKKFVACVDDQRARPKSDFEHDALLELPLVNSLSHGT
jgi:hypothetical protein